jgi:hypothetical protein
MIRTDAEYKAAVARLAAEKDRLRQQEKDLRAEGLDAAARKRVLDPLRSFHEQLVEEVASYERLQRGDVGELENLHGLGRFLIALRLARGLTQRQLAEKLEVHETQVSRDERNEYHGVTVERASRILDVLKADVRTGLQRARSTGGRRVVRSAGRGRSVRKPSRPKTPAQR